MKVSFFFLFLSPSLWRAFTDDVCFPANRRVQGRPAFQACVLSQSHTYLCGAVQCSAVGGGIKEINNCFSSISPSSSSFFYLSHFFLPHAPYERRRHCIVQFSSGCLQQLRKRKKERKKRKNISFLDDTASCDVTRSCVICRVLIPPHIHPLKYASSSQVVNCITEIETTKNTDHRISPSHLI